MSKDQPKIKVTKDGPYLVSGSLPLIKEIITTDDNGDPLNWQELEKYPDRREYVLCRCGKSKMKPYCDGSHIASAFDGTEKSQKPYLVEAEKTVGPDLDLTDWPKLCSSAGFCHRAGGTWKLTEKSDDPENKKTAVEQSCNCPSGRLVAWEKDGRAIEPELEPAISVTEHEEEKISGPLWVKGGVAIESADGAVYEKRNRVTLCRCGKSKNKPFCDSAHVDVEFSDKE